MLKRVAAATWLLVASANAADDLLPSVGLVDAAAVEHEDQGRALVGTPPGVEVSNAIILQISSIFSLSLSSIFYSAFRHSLSVQSYLYPLIYLLLHECV